MKFRRLDQEELQELESEFINFLSSNTITAEDWQKIKIEDPKKAEGLIDIFSDIVFEKTIKKVEYLEHKTKQDIKIFKCLEDKMILAGLTIEGESDIDFTLNLSPEEMITQLRSSNARLKMYQAEKAYDNNARSVELFQMMEKGCLITNDHLFNILIALRGDDDNEEK